MTALEQENQFLSKTLYLVSVLLVQIAQTDL